MKRLSTTMKEGGGTGVTVDLYLVVFLKFIASVVPTLEYDYTFSV